MFSIGFLTGALALLCFVGVVTSIVRRRLSKQQNAKSFDQKGVFFAIGFVPMVLMALSSFRFSSPALMNFFAIIRNPFISFEIAFNTFAGFQEASLVMDFFTAVLLGSSVVITLSDEYDSLMSDRRSGGKMHSDVQFGLNTVDSADGAVYYLEFCRFLS